MYIEGQRVVINHAGFTAYGESETNPQGVIGTVVDHGGEEGWVGVEWGNGEFNEYEAGTLDVVEVLQ